MKYALPIICLFIVFTSPALSQDAINAGVYYPPSKAINYPFLASTSVSTASAGISTINNHTAGNTACCAPLFPTIAQGIRDTFSAIFPCRGIRRQAGQGLLFSARFYEGSCCNKHIPSGEVILGPAGEPTPATEIPVPEEIEPELIEDSVRFRPLPSGNIPTVLTGAPTTIRVVSGRLNVPPQVNRPYTTNRNHPVNPLRQ